MRVEKEYRFDTDEGRSQLLVYHFMVGPSYEAGCPVCSSMADGVNALLPYLHAPDVTMLLVSRAPLERLQAYKRRMGWPRLRRGGTRRSSGAMAPTRFAGGALRGTRC